MNISLPDRMKAWVDDRVTHGGYGTTSEYFRQLVREDQQKRLREEIDAKLLAALDQGEAIEMTPQWWDDRRKELERRVGRQSSKP